MRYQPEFVSVRSSTARARIASALAEHGIAFVSDLADRHVFLKLARVLCVVAAHRDSDDNGITVIEDRFDLQRWIGMRGMSSDELTAHTDGSSLRRPPGLLMLMCERPAAVGGESLFCDGQEVHRTLLENEPAALNALSASGCARFGESKYGSPVFERDQTGEITIRFRYDELVEFAPSSFGAVEKMLHTIQSNTKRIRLRAGEGYILNNRRWLHARTAYSGDRRFYRILGEQHPELGIAQGFGASARVVTVAGVGDQR